LRSGETGLKPFTLSPILLQCHGDAGGILCAHYSRVKIDNLGDKIVPEQSFWLVVHIMVLSRIDWYISQQTNLNFDSTTRIIHGKSGQFKMEMAIGS